MSLFSPLFYHHHAMKLGKRPARHDKRTLFLADYVASLPKAPDNYRLSGIPDTTPTLWENDKYGDCTKAAWAGLVYSVSQAAGKPFLYPDDDVLFLYEDCDGFRPSDPSTDNGSDGLTTLNYLMKSGAFGHPPHAFVQLQSGKAEEYRLAASYIGGVYIGIALPRAWQGKTVWDVPLGGPSGDGAPWSWGGHMIYGKAEYNNQGPKILTWGQTYQLTWDAYEAYVDEAYAVIAEDFQSPDGFDHNQLQQDLAAIKAA